MRALLLAIRILTFADNPERDSAELLPSPIAPAAKLSSATLRAFSCVDRGAVREVRTCDLAQIAAPDAAGDFAAPPHADVVDASPDPAAEGSAFFHAARMRTFLEGLAGHPLAPTVDVVAGLRVPSSLLAGDLAAAASPDAALAPFPLAFYLPAGANPAFDRIYGTSHGTVWLGRGAMRDLAYDGDVIGHEMTHALLDGALFSHGFRLGPLGASVEPESLNEALADYFAAALAEDPIVNEWSSGEAGIEGGYRDLGALVTCPAAIDGLSHDESLLLSGALWSARASLEPAARGAFDADVFRAATSLPARADVGFADLVDALAPDGKARASAELARRNVGCDPILILTGPLRSRGAGFFAPGTGTLGIAPAPGVLQLAVAIPAGTGSLAVDFQPSVVAPGLFEAARAPFDPAVVVSWDTPVRFRGASSNAAASAPATGDAIAHAELPVPATARTAYLQIVNRATGDGLYDYVSVNAVPATAAAPLRASGSGCAAAPDGARGGPFLLAGVVAALTAARSRGGTGRRRSSAAARRSSTSSSRR